ncbi:DUF2000 domain-containing protein [Saccharothrix obliqua]|uniref:DUF2000 domain-containing protein n=1 Tax=Saccharothrix obliqua TaxID=2861747 RepID=UPI001C5FAC05|nr:DUF2000 domain-containing protein [Saccharothrix obliqua]MBW4719108.1 DUF2000 domain-containing protein [Saccharothrix obliqua]
MLSTKITLVLRADLPPNLAANAAVVLGLSLGARLPDILGTDGADADGTPHAAITDHPVPVLTAPAEELKALHRADGVTAVGFTEVARRARAYDAYLRDLAATADPDFVAVALHGPREVVTRLTRRLPLMG